MSKRKINDDSTNETKVRKISVNLQPENEEKINKLIEESGGVLTKTDIINNAIANIPIICIGDRKSIASCFFDIRNALLSDDMTMAGEEAKAACLLLSSLMEKIEGISH